MNDREKLKQKLRTKINEKTNVKIQKLVEVLQEENITVNTQLTEELIEKVTGILSRNEIKKVLSQIESNPEVNDNFKTFMQNVSNFKPP
jgi:superfamily I DNA and/or RNA helicase